jgi:hypothetical protein
VVRLLVAAHTLIWQAGNRQPIGVQGFALVGLLAEFFYGTSV